MKKLLAILMALVMAFAFAACSAKPADDTTSTEAATQAAAENKVIRLSTTPSVNDSGLLPYLQPFFEAATGYQMEVTSAGTGAAIKKGETGDADALLVHAKASEEEFVANGFGVERFPVMYNDFVIVGPKDKLMETEDVASVFGAINAQELPFVSRGDDSGTDKKEKKIWEALEIDPARNPNYIESGQGMGATLTMANEKEAFCLTDRGTWLKQSKDSETEYVIDIVCEGDPQLLNQYGVIAVNPEKFPEVNNEAANAFIEWITSDEVQKLIGEYGVEEYGQALFTPNAGTDN